jgi:hypothetical protein
MNTWEQAYYLVVVLSVGSYILGLHVFRLPVLTFSSVNYALSVILAMLPGYVIAQGGHLPAE